MQKDLEITQEKQLNAQVKEPIIKIRYIQLCLLTLLTIICGLKSNLSVAIIAMTSNSSSNPDIPVYEWSNTSIILSSFYWTYFIVQFFSGCLGQTHGPKWYCFAGMFLNSMANLVIPPISASNFGSNGVMACRLVQGFALGTIIPLLHTMLGRWAPARERSWMSTTVYGGHMLGGIIATSSTGVISASWIGWPASFYIFGVIGLTWCVLWAIFGSNSPAEDSRISVQEKNYIEASLEQQNYERKISATPWRSIFMSLPVWAIIVASVGESWGGTLLSTEMPTYLSKTTGLNIQSSGLISSAPLALATLTSFCSGPISDFLIAKQWVSRINCRRIFHGIGSFIPSAALMWLAYASESLGLVAFLLIIAVGTSTATMSGHTVNIIDISPKYSGIIWGIANGIGQGVAVLAPVIVHFVVTDETNKYLWRMMFTVAAVIYAGTALFFIICLSGEKQLWDSEEEKKNDENGVINTKIAKINVTK